MPAPRAASQAAALEPEVLDTESRHLAAMLTLARNSGHLPLDGTPAVLAV